MSFTQQVLDDVRAQIAPEDAALKEAHERRDTTRTAAEAFAGVRHSFASGSLAHGTANCPIHERDQGLDADTGVVLDRRSHPTLGPDAADRGGLTAVVEAMRDHLRRELRADYPQVRFRVTKRAILVSFGEPLPGGERRAVDRRRILDPDIAKEIIEFRDREFPLGFRHVKELLASIFHEACCGAL